MSAGGAAAPRSTLPPASMLRAAAPSLVATRSSTSVRLSVALAALAISGCAAVAPGSTSNLGGDSFSGRLALRVDAIGSEAARSFGAAFDLRGDARSGVLGLSTPLGSTLAQARWSPLEVTLVTPQSTRRFADLDALTREALGESVPIEAWFDWLRGRPWPGAPSIVSETPPGFVQLGWRVDTAQLGDGGISATRPTPTPAVTVRIRLDR